MKILLLYPKPVEGASLRETRLDHQLSCLATLTRRLLEEADIAQNFAVREIAYKAVDNTSQDAPASEMFGDIAVQHFSTADLLALYDSSDLVIEICGDKRTQAEFYEYQGAAITLRPTYPGSFSQNDINIECRNMEEKAWLTERVIEATKMAEETARVSEFVEPDMHYSQFSPLPYRLSKEFYSRPRQHALVFLSYGAGENSDTICDQDQHQIASLLHDMEDLAALTIVTDTLATAPRAKTIAKALQNALGLETKVFSHRRGDYRDLFSVLAKCDVALFAGSSLYVDSIRLGVPAYIWRSKQAGTDPLNDAFMNLLEDASANEVLSEQRIHLDRLIESHYLGATLPNDKRVLLEALSAIMSKLAPGIYLETSGYINNPAVPEPVIDQPRVWHTNTLSTRMKHRISRGRRKFTKFKQSPERFFEDSENPLAKRLYTMIR